MTGSGAAAAVEGSWTRLTASLKVTGAAGAGVSLAAGATEPAFPAGSSRCLLCRGGGCRRRVLLPPGAGLGRGSFADDALGGDDDEALAVRVGGTDPDRPAKLGGGLGDEPQRLAENGGLVLGLDRVGGAVDRDFAGSVGTQNGVDLGEVECLGFHHLSLLGAVRGCEAVDLPGLVVRAAQQLHVVVAGIGRDYDVAAEAVAFVDGELARGR